MKKIIGFALFFSFVFCIQTNAQDAKAKAILNQVSTKFKSAKNLHANFSFGINNAKGVSQSSKSGTFSMKGDKYKVDLGSQQIICDGKSVWTYLKDNKEVQVSTFNPNEQAISPSKLFSGSYEKEYKIAYGGSKSIAGKNVDVIELTPLKQQGFSKVILYVDKGSSMISGGQMFEKNGGSYTYTISNVKMNTNLNDSDFTFNTKQHPGVEVIDLR